MFRTQDSVEEEDPDSPTKLKLVLVGEKFGGKTCMVLRFCRDTFSTTQKATVGAAFQTKTVTLSNKRVILNIWDTGGEEKYHCLAPMYYRNANGAVVVYDITDMQSFERARAWVKELRDHSGTDTVIALAGNKVDLEELRNVPHQLAKNFAREENLAFYETSAKDNINVSEAFMFVARQAAQTSNSSLHGFTLEDGDPQQAPGGACWC